MIKTYRFNIAPVSAALDPIEGHGCQHQQNSGPLAKPTFAIDASGWLVISISDELEKALGRTTLERTRSAPVLLCAYFETTQAVYKVHVATRVQLSLQEQSVRQDTTSPQGATPC